MCGASDLHQSLKLAGAVQTSGDPCSHCCRHLSDMVKECNWLQHAVLLWDWWWWWCFSSAINSCLHSFDCNVRCQHLHCYSGKTEKKNKTTLEAIKKLSVWKWDNAHLCFSHSLVRRAVIFYISARPTRLSPPGHWHSHADNYDLPHCPCKQADGMGNICLAAECFWPWVVRECTPIPTPHGQNNQNETHL